MERIRCDHCGREASLYGDVCCSEGAMTIGGKKKGYRRYIILAGVLIPLAGSLLWHGYSGAGKYYWEDLSGATAAVINGEPVTRSEVRERLRISRVMLEKQYGSEIFAGEKGRVLLVNLEQDLLEKILAERLVAREARRMNIQVGDEAVREKMQKIATEIYGNWDNFQASLREDGISQEYLRNHLRNLLVQQEVARAKAPPQADPDAYFVVWLNQAREEAKVDFIRKTVSAVEASSQGQGGCGGSGGGGCGGCGGKQASAGPLDPALKSQASAVALEAYRQANPAATGLEAKVTDFGCHIQVDIEKGGKIIWSYTYENGRVIDNS